jgi:hypothetical protein
MLRDYRMTHRDTRPFEPDPDVLRSFGEGKLYRAAIEPIWDTVSIYGSSARFLAEFAAVSPAQGLLFAANWCQSEVCNGGFHQFFSNSTGILAPEAARGFERLMLDAVADLVSRCIRMFGEVYPRGRVLRTKAVRALERPGKSGDEWHPFSSMDREFYSLTGTAKFAEQADAFVRSNMELFFRPAQASPMSN